MSLPVLRRRHILSALALLFLTGFVVVWIFRLDLLTWAALRTLERQGLAPAHFTIEAIGLNTLRTRDVSLAGGAIRADEMSFTFDPLELVGGQFGDIEISGFSISITQTENGFVFGGIAPAADAEEGPRGNPLSRFHIGSLSIRDALVTFENDSLKLEALLSANLSLADGVLQGEALSADVTATMGETVHLANASVGTFAVNMKTTSEGELSFGQGAVDLPDYPWTARAIAGSFAWNGDKSDARLTVETIANTDTPTLHAPFGLTADISTVATTSDITLHGRLKDRPAIGLDAKGTYDRAANAASISFNSTQIAFASGKLQPEDLLPRLAGIFKDIAGTVSADGKLRWAEQALKPEVTIRLKDMSAPMPNFQVKSLNGNITLNKLWPIATPRGQRISATLESSLFPPGKAVLTGQLTDTFTFRVEGLGIDIAGGSISTTPFTINPNVADISTTLKIDRLDFAEVMNLLSIEGLRGTGRLEGNLPFTVRSARIAINNGVLASQGAGTLQYKPTTLPQELSSADDSVDLTLKALTNFHYENLRIELDKKVTGEGVVFLKMSGENPVFMPGQPFNFNIRVESNFDTLADYIALSLSSAQELLRRAAEVRH